MDALSAALEVAAGGFPVFPVKLCPDACLRCSICKAPATRHGFHDASSNPDEVRQLWSQHPGALIGMPTGEVSDVDVLDLDCAKEPAAVVWWMSHRNRIPHTRTHQSGNGGLHLLFRHHGLSRTGNGRVGPGVDVKANGGYIVWWPAYGRKLVLDAPISEWPDWLIDRQQPKIDAMPSLRAKTPQGLEGVANFVASRPEGERNCSTFWGFCRAYEAVTRRRDLRVRGGVHPHCSGAAQRATGKRDPCDRSKRQDQSGAPPMTPACYFNTDALRVGWEPPSLDEINGDLPSGPRLLSSGAFIEGFTPPDYLVDSILQRRFIYSMTGRTGEGKTSVCLRLAAHVAEGLTLNGAAVSKGRVLYLAGENPDDIRMWIALIERMGLDENAVDVDFIDGRFSLSEIPDHIIAAANEKQYALVVVDTSAAFSQSADENDNVEQGEHARTLRGLIDRLPGGPTILTCCHPPKNATDDNLQPRGGGAFIAEFDGNLTCRRTETATEVHWQGKFRGPDFAPMHFILEGVTTARLKDSRGNQVWTVFANPASEQDKEEISRALKSDATAIMVVIRDQPGISLADIARRMSWHNKQMLPDKSKAQRRIRALEKKKLVERDDDALELTDKGKAWLAKQQGKNKEATPKDGPDLTLVKS